MSLLNNACLGLLNNAFVAVLPAFSLFVLTYSAKVSHKLGLGRIYLLELTSQGLIAARTVIPF